MTDERYCYPPDYTVLKNQFGLRDAQSLDDAERLTVANRLQQTIPQGQFDLNHLQAIHHHLFQDVYDWAGKIREVEIAKGGHQFQARRFIEAGMEDVHKRLREEQFLKGRNLDDFANGAGRIIGDVNYVHPFREGNGRTQAVYLKQLSQQAGHQLDLATFEREKWIGASREAHNGNYEPFQDHIREALERSREQAREEQRRLAQERSQRDQNHQRDRSRDRER